MVFSSRCFVVTPVELSSSSSSGSDISRPEQPFGSQMGVTRSSGGSQMRVTGLSPGSMRTPLGSSPSIGASWSSTSDQSRSNEPVAVNQGAENAEVVLPCNGTNFFFMKPGKYTVSTNAFSANPFAGHDVSGQFGTIRSGTNLITRFAAGHQSRGVSGIDGSMPPQNNRPYYTCAVCGGLAVSAAQESFYNGCRHRGHVVAPATIQRPNVGNPGPAYK